MYKHGFGLSRRAARSKTFVRVFSAFSAVVLLGGVIGTVSVEPAFAGKPPVNGIGSISCSGAKGTLHFVPPLSSSGPASSDTASATVKLKGCNVPGGNVTTPNFNGKAKGTILFPTQNCTILNGANSVTGSLTITWTGLAGKRTLSPSTLTLTSLTGVQSGQNGDVGFTFTHQATSGSFSGSLSGELDSNATASTINGSGQYECGAPKQKNGVNTLKIVAGSLASGTTIAPEGSCEGAGSLAALVNGTSVITYVPRGNWESDNTGIDVVNAEGSSVHNTVIPTDQAVNSCASNSVTGQTVCVSNGNEVYVLKGTGLDPSVSPNPLTDGATGSICFSGGCPSTADVSMDATHNRALIAAQRRGRRGVPVPGPGHGHIRSTDHDG